jgi:hypothetical protein
MLMSYHLAHPRRQREELPPPVAYYQPSGLVPLSDATSPQLSHGMNKGLVIAVVVVVVILLLLWWLDPGDSRPDLQRNPVKKMSTAELAKNLYERLERRGGTHPTTMRSLERYARDR